MARPKKNIDPEQVERMAAVQMSVEQIANVLNVDKRTIERRFAAVIKNGREKGKMGLMRKQYEVAMGGNVSMLIWLGKVLLNQSETLKYAPTELKTEGDVYEFLRPKKNGPDNI